VLVVTDIDTQEVVERWGFDVQTDKQVLSTGYGSCQRHSRACATYGNTE